MNERAHAPAQLSRLRIELRGAVQGVGFRPFVFRLANELGLTGWVSNSGQGVHLEIEGDRGRLELFRHRLDADKPPRAFIQGMEAAWLDAVGYADFVIRASEVGGLKTALVLPDIATCADCLAEIFDPRNRRYLYPFTNCTNCGPRFSIIEALPYDRANTSMKSFTMCPQCQQEYDDPADRRFHAQPNACSRCGPWLELWSPAGTVLAGRPEADARPAADSQDDGPLSKAASAIASGRIVALKGLGGFQLLAVAADNQTVARLRQRKHREEKPFAVMFPSLGAVREVCAVSRLEERLLQSPEAPIVLLRRLKNVVGPVSSAVAPGNPNLGVMLPYTPLHHLLLGSLRVPVVATSGNLSDEPMCLDEREALARLDGIADLFLVHNRPIVRVVDDSIARVTVERELVLRRARGYAPLPLQVRAAPARTTPLVEDASPAFRKTGPDTTPRTVLAVGAHLKSAVALAIGPQVFISQHIGDLETAQAHEAFRRVAADLQQLYDSPAELVAADAHPDYLSTRFAEASGLRCVKVQHHVAHVLSCMAENELEPPALGVAWDGTGYGLDGSVWGGEFFLIKNHDYERIAHFRQFRLPGGEQAIKEPRRSALGLLFDAFGDAAFDRSDLETIASFSTNEKAALRQMLQRGLNSPLTSSVGRLFDAVASLLGLRQRVHFEGQAAMELEFLVDAGPGSGSYPLVLSETSAPSVLDCRPSVQALLADLRQGVAPATISVRFHNTLVRSVLEVAQRAAVERVVLSGGCFQNHYLLEETIRVLLASGFRPYWHQRVPPNDGGICLGQVVAARWWTV